MNNTGELAIEIFEHDPPHYVRMKKYMAQNGIVAINMRQLSEVELLKIQTINPDVELSTSSTNNKEMIGNAVPPKMVTALANEYDRSERTKINLFKAA